MRSLADFLGYLKNKRFVRNYETKPKNECIATREYCNAVVDIIIYESSKS